MVNAKIDAELVGYAEFQKRVQSAVKAVGDLSPAFNSIANDWLKNNRQIFRLKSKGQYKDLSTKPFFAYWERTARFRKFYEGGYKQMKKEKYGFAYPILKATGKLEKSLTDRNDPNCIVVLDSKSLIMGTNVEYGIYHQSARPRTKIPYRPFIINKEGVSTPTGKIDTWGKQSARWLRIIETYVSRQINK